MPKPPEIDYDQLALAIIRRREADSAGIAMDRDPGPEWVGKLIDGLAPFKTLLPARGPLDAEQKRKLHALNSSQARFDLNDAIRPTTAERVRDRKSPRDHKQHAGERV